MFRLRVKTLSARDCHWRNSRKKISAHVRALTGSVPCKLAEGQQSVLAPCWNQIKNSWSPDSSSQCRSLHGLQHCISFATDLAAKLAIDSESCQGSFPSFWTPSSEVAVLFNWNLCRHLFLSQVLKLDLLLCTGFNLEHADLFLCPIFTLRPMNDWKIEQSNELCFSW